MFKILKGQPTLLGIVRRIQLSHTHSHRIIQRLEQKNGSEKVLCGMVAGDIHPSSKNIKKKNTWNGLFQVVESMTND